MLSYILVPLFISISANLLTPVVKSYLDDNDSPKQVSVNKIKKLPSNLANVVTDGLRFITGNNVHLRKAPSTSAKVLDEMIFGQVVTIVSKKRNWIEIMYEYDSGDTMQGWVFTRYTKKFHK